MAHITRDEHDGRTTVCIHLTNSDVVMITDAASPTAALAGVILALADAGLGGPIVSTIVAVTAWALKRKNAEFGYQGLRITFDQPHANGFGAVVPLFMIETTVVTAASIRIKAPA